MASARVETVLSGHVFIFPYLVMNGNRRVDYVSGSAIQPLAASAAVTHLLCMWYYCTGLGALYHPLLSVESGSYRKSAASGFFSVRCDANPNKQTNTRQPSQISHGLVRACDPVFINTNSLLTRRLNRDHDFLSTPALRFLHRYFLLNVT